MVLTLDVAGRSSVGASGVGAMLLLLVWFSGTDY